MCIYTVSWICSGNLVLSTICFKAQSKCKTPYCWKQSLSGFSFYSSDRPTLTSAEGYVFSRLPLGDFSDCWGREVEEGCCSYQLLYKSKGVFRRFLNPSVVAVYDVAEKCCNLALRVVSLLLDDKTFKKRTKRPGRRLNFGLRPYVDFTENMEQIPGFFSGRSLVFVFCFVHFSQGKLPVLSL